MPTIVRNIIIKSFLIHIRITLDPFRQFRLCRQVEAVCRPEWERESELLAGAAAAGGQLAGSPLQYHCGPIKKAICNLVFPDMFIHMVKIMISLALPSYTSHTILWDSYQRPYAILSWALNGGHKKCYICALSSLNSFLIGLIFTGPNKNEHEFASL